MGRPTFMWKTGDPEMATPKRVRTHRPKHSDTSLSREWRINMANNKKKCLKSAIISYKMLHSYLMYKARICLCVCLDSSETAGRTNIKLARLITLSGINFFGCAICLASGKATRAAMASPTSFTVI